MLQNKSKYLWTTVLIIILCCILFGACLPSVVFSNLTKKELSTIEKYSIKTPEVTIANDIIDVMRIAYNAYYEFDYQASNANLSKDDLVEVCNAFVDGLALDEWGFAPISVDASNMDAKCILAVSDDSSASAVIWNVQVQYAADAEILIKVDDKNKKVISISHSVCDEMESQSQSADNIYDGEESQSQSKDSTYDESGLHEYYVSEMLTEYLAYYYGLDTSYSGEENEQLSDGRIKLSNGSSEINIEIYYIYDGFDILPIE